MNLPNRKLLLELHWREAIVVAMTPDRIIKYLDIVEYVSLGLFSGFIALSILLTALFNDIEIRIPITIATSTPHIFEGLFVY